MFELRFNFLKVTKNLLSQHKYYHQPNIIDDYVHLICNSETSLQSSVHWMALFNRSNTLVRKFLDTKTIGIVWITSKLSNYIRYHISVVRGQSIVLTHFKEFI